MSSALSPPRGIQLILALAILLTHTSTAIAHHPGADLDKVMGSKEKFFQPIDRKSPDFVLRDVGGRIVKLDDLREKIVILNFIYTKCPDVCPLHAEYLSKVQSMINQTPMKGMVRFVSITTDPVNDTADGLKAYGEIHGSDRVNWSYLTTTSGQPEDTTRKLAEDFGHKFTKTGDDYQVHSVVTHVIDREGRWAANFYGLRFNPVNLVLYVNGLTNNPNVSQKEKPQDLWDRLKGLF